MFYVFFFFVLSCRMAENRDNVGNFELSDDEIDLNLDEVRKRLEMHYRRRNRVFHYIYSCEECSNAIFDAWDLQETVYKNKKEYYRIFMKDLFGKNVSWFEMRERRCLKCSNCGEFLGVVVSRPGNDHVKLEMTNVKSRRMPVSV